MQLPGRRVRRGGTAALVAVGLLVAAVLAVLVLGRPASAALDTASPAYGAYVGAPPAAITLTFTAAVAQAHMEVSGALASPPVVDQRTVTVPVSIAAPGRYVAAYHVVTVDGAELTGTLPFTVAASGQADGAGVAGQADGAGAAPAEKTPVETAQPPAHRHGDADPLTLAVIAVNVLVVLVLGALFLRRRPRRAAGT